MRKVFDLKRSMFGDCDWVDCIGKSVVCDEVMKELFDLRRYKEARLVLSDKPVRGAIRATRLTSYLVKLFEEDHEVFIILGDALDEMEIDHGSSVWFWMEVPT